MQTEEIKVEKVKARDFTKDEISEINQYVVTNVPYSILQTIFPLTENPVKKAEVYTIVYRFIVGAKNYVALIETRKKLGNLLRENAALYEEIYVELLRMKNPISNWGSHRSLQRMYIIFSDMSKNKIMNNLIDIFLVFAEKQVLLDIENVVGINMDSEEGRTAYQRISTTSKDSFKQDGKIEIEKEDTAEIDYEKELAKDDDAEKIIKEN